LSELLAQVSDEDVSVLDVLQQVYSHSTFPEKAKRHYFRVVMDGVDVASDLTNVSEVISYISQNAPVPYDKAAFPWGYEITQRIRKEGFAIRSYNIFVNYGNAHQKIYKPYKGEFLSDKGKQIYDKIHDIEIVKFNNSDGTLSAIGWIAKTSFLGSIYDKSIKGLRVRKGNILIGDQQTLNVLFKDARFNGWSVGEIFAVDPRLIPNARRDNFEKNAAYFSLIEQMMPLAAKITKTIRSTSATRNHELSAALKAIDDVSTQTNQALSTGVSSSQKGTLHSNLSRAQNLLGGVSANGDADAYFQEIAFEELDMLIGRIKGATSYKALNTIEHLSTTEKHILERVFNILISADQDNAPQVIDTILEGFAK
jgi:molecular chaperone HtpG